MIRQALMFKGIFLSNEEFKEVMEATTQDIKFNKIRFNKLVKLDEVVQIAICCYKVLKICA